MSPLNDPQQTAAAYSRWFAWCEFGCHWALRVYWWHGGDTSCKRHRKRNGSWRYIKAVLDGQS